MCSLWASFIGINKHDLSFLFANFIWVQGYNTSSSPLVQGISSLGEDDAFRVYGSPFWSLFVFIGCWYVCDFFEELLSFFSANKTPFSSTLSLYNRVLTRKLKPC